MMMDTMLFVLYNRNTYHKRDKHDIRHQRHFQNAQPRNQSHSKKLNPNDGFGKQGKAT
jgi:hypothetical protein